MTVRMHAALPPMLAFVVALLAAYAIASIPTLGVASATPDVAPTPATSATEAELWRTGAPHAAILTALCAVLLFIARLDPRRALRWASAAALIGFVPDSLRTGDAPTASMLLSTGAVLGGVALPGVIRPRQRRRSPRAATVRGDEAP